MDEEAHHEDPFGSRANLQKQPSRPPLMKLQCLSVRLAEVLGPRHLTLVAMAWWSTMSSPHGPAALSLVPILAAASLSIPRLNCGVGSAALCSIFRPKKRSLLAVVVLHLSVHEDEEGCLRLGSWKIIWNLSAPRLVWW